MTSGVWWFTLGLAASLLARGVFGRSRKPDPALTPITPITPPAPSSPSPTRTGVGIAIGGFTVGKTCDGQVKISWDQTLIIGISGFTLPMPLARFLRDELIRQCDIELPKTAPDSALDSESAHAASANEKEDATRLMDKGET